MLLYVMPKPKIEEVHLVARVETPEMVGQYRKVLQPGDVCGGYTYEELMAGNIPEITV